jgi:hypothetical protein
MCGTHSLGLLLGEDGLQIPLLLDRGRWCRGSRSDVGLFLLRIGYVPVVL